MKKILLTAIISLLAWTGLSAQDIDTLPCGQRQPNYFYPIWYDTASWYLKPDEWRMGYGLDQWEVHFNPWGSVYSHSAVIFQQYTENPVRIQGLWAMVSQKADGFPDRDYNPQFGVSDNSKLPEFLYLYVRNPKVDPDTVGWGPTFWLFPVAHARWDTNQPKMLCVKQTDDERFPNRYCHIYEAHFDTAYTIQGEFWIGGTQNSNNVTISLPVTDHFPTNYLGWGTSRDQNVRNSPYSHFIYGNLGPEGPWPSYDPTMKSPLYGPFGVITDGQHYVHLASADSTQGMALYTAFYPDSSYQTITAAPNHGFLFSHWNDGDTTNPRTVFVTSDTAFTAFFRPAPLFSVSVRSDNDSLGYVLGDSSYFQNDPAVIKAVPLGENALFTHWNDGDTLNPRSFIVTRDTSFTAYFEWLEPQGIHSPDKEQNLFSLSPNPAGNSVTITILNPQSYIHRSTLTLRDAAGREIRSFPVTSSSLTIPLHDCPAGSYLVTLTTPQATSTQRLIIK